MSRAIGIDLGTTNSVGAIVHRGQVEFVPSETGDILIPSVVSYTSDQVLVGVAAKRRALLHPHSTFSDTKRLIGSPTTWTVGNQEISPTSVAAKILGQLKHNAEMMIGETITNAVITVPAYFNSEQKSATLEAGKMAGLNVLRLLSEPTAAAISYGLNRARPQVVMVYDFGGGTFDISIVKIDPPNFEVLAVEGDSLLGGRDVDITIADWLLTHVPHMDGVVSGGISRALRGSTDETDRDRRAVATLLEAAEVAKKNLSESVEVEVTLPSALECPLEARLTRSVLAELVRPLVDKTADCIDRALRASGLTCDDVDRIVLAGGSSRLPSVRSMLADRYREPFSADSLDLVVASGAATMAHWLSSPELITVPIVIDVTPHDLGVRLHDGSHHVLIRRNTPLPATQTYAGFTTARSNQKSVEIAVFQGGAPVAEQNHFVGQFELAGIPPGAAGEPIISVTFRMDNSDILSVSALCGTSKAEKQLTVTSGGHYVPTKRTPGVDCVFLIDTSGSMARELDGIKGQCQEFADNITREGIDVRLGLVDFDLPLGTSQYNVEVFPLMSPQEFRGAISQLQVRRLGGYGCYLGDEGSVKVLEVFLTTFAPSGRVPVGILISDEVSQQAPTEAGLLRQLQNSGITLHVLGVAGSCHERLAAKTGGCFWDIKSSRSTSFTEVLSNVAHEVTALALRSAN